MRATVANQYLTHPFRTVSPRTPVNKGKEKAGDPYCRTPASLPHPLARGKQGLTPSAVKRLLLRVDHPAGSRDGRFLGQRRIQLALACRLEVVAAIVVQVNPVLHDGLLAQVLRHIVRD